MISKFTPNDNKSSYESLTESERILVGILMSLILGTVACFTGGLLIYSAVFLINAVKTLIELFQ